MIRFDLEGTAARAEGMDVVEDIRNLMDRINRRDTRMAFQVNRDHGDGERCADPRSVYANLAASLSAALMALGVPEDRLEKAREDLVAGHDVWATVNLHSRVTG